LEIEIMTTTYVLKEHQREALDWLVNIEKNVAPYGGILADDMGLGKTLESLSVVLANRLPHTLVVVPASLVEQWVTEINKVSKDLDIRIDDPTGDITVTSYFKAAHRENLQKMSWDRVILDEGHVIRNHKTKTYKGLARLKTNHRWVLSGTPIQNKLGDLKNLLRFVGIQFAGKDDTEVEEILKTYVLRRTKAGLGIEMPKLTVTKHYIDFDTESDRRHYESENFGIKTKIAGNEWMLVRLLRLRQFTLLPRMVVNSYEKKKDIDGEVPVYKNTKLDSVVNCVKKNIATQKPIVFCHFKEEMDYLEEKLKEKDLKVARIDGSVSQSKRTELVKNHATYDVLIAQLMTASVGLNLQMFNSIIFTAPHWNPTHERQAVCRAYRIGQTRDVFVHRFVIKDTIEHEIVDRQKFKRSIAKRFNLD
jgi:SNF2 family DNA or RNA helicase